MVSVLLTLFLALVSPSASAESPDYLHSSSRPVETEESEEAPQSPSPGSSFNDRWQSPDNPAAHFKERWPANGTFAKGCLPRGCVNLPKLPVPDFNAITRTAERKSAFLNYFGPQALMLQKATGYPASLMLAQWAQESGWGSSDNYVQFNNIAGHRCWKKDQVETVKVRIPGRVQNVRRVCQLKEGSTILYWKFDNALDATLAYLDNLLYCEDTAKAYQSIRAEVARAKEEGVRWQKLMPGLSEYCPWDSYQIEVPQVLRQNKLEDWEKKSLCSCS